ncbi:restriction endonuclease subunit S [Janibacter limosus]|uniref:restriction endonuclease subunit S n=1 Tax=Janibacter limosus TaxID=53458 RepID=UPI0013EEAB45|nr:restriction endonuclease subunit S [Janibacter limosus]
MSVEWVRVGDVLELQRTPIDIELTESYKRIGIYSWGRGLLHRSEVPGTEMGSLRYYTFPTEALILSNIQAWEAAVAVTSEAETGYVASNRFLPYVPKTERVDVRYLAHYFVSERGLGQLRSASPGTQVRNRTLGKKLFEELRIPLPPIDEQRRIAAHLDAVQDYVAHLASESITFPLQRLPTVVGDVITEAGLPVTTVGELLSVVNTTIHPGEPLQGATEFVGLEHIASHTGDRLGSRAIHEETGRKFLFRPGQVTFGYLRPYLNKAWVADRTGLCSVEQFILEPVDGLAPELLAHLLRSAHVLDRAVAATNRLQLPRLSLKTLLAMEVPDIRVAQPGLTRRLDLLRDQFVTLSRIDKRREVLRDGMLPAARNEIFTAMR